MWADIAAYREIPVEESILRSIGNENGFLKNELWHCELRVLGKLTDLSLPKSLYSTLLYYKNCTYLRKEKKKCFVLFIYYYSVISWFIIQIQLEHWQVWSTTSKGSLFQSLPNLMEKKCFLTSSLNLLWHRFVQLLCDLWHVTREQSPLAPSASPSQKTAESSETAS